MAPNPPPMAPSAAAATTHRVLAASSQKGAQVHNFAGEQLGKVDDFVLDFDSGRIAFVIVSVGGFLGFGDKLFAVPWDLFSTRKDHHEFFLDVEKQMLLDAPGFERSAWPDMGDPSWAAKVHAHFAQKPYWNSEITDAGDYVGDNRYDKPDRDRI
jgi:sporulation protein YlmC with PRC-barrel domain